MTACEQTAGLSVLAHGEQVHDYYLDLVNFLNGGEFKYQWRLPEWLNSHLLCFLPPIETMCRYHVFHDCGKPYCLFIDDEGRRHFPDHATASAIVAKVTGFSEQEVELISRDMDIHLLKDVGVDEFCQQDNAIALLLTGLAEIHANAAMFGGIESQSFKQKWKQINRRGKKITALT